MGIGNLVQALSLYGVPRGIPYAQLYFDSTPLRHEAAQQFLARLGDDSSTYLWRVEAAREVMRLLRDDRGELERRAQLQTARNSAEVLLHPPDQTEVFADAGALKSAYDDGDLVALPGAYLRAHGVAIDRGMGALAAAVGADPALYRGLRREALATLAYIGTQVRRISGARAPLRVTSTVRDERYQRALLASDPEATSGYSLHTTGYAFDVARDYASRAQALAFQFVLDRLTALDLVAWVREPAAIHVTVVYPVSTDTDFFDVMSQETGTTVVRGPGPRQGADTVADAIARAIERPVPEVYPYFKSRALVWLNAFAPGLADRMVQRFGRKPVR